MVQESQQSCFGTFQVALQERGTGTEYSLVLCCNAFISASSLQSQKVASAHSEMISHPPGATLESRRMGASQELFAYKTIRKMKWMMPAAISRVRSNSSLWFWLGGLGWRFCWDIVDLCWPAHYRWLSSPWHTVETGVSIHWSVDHQLSKRCEKQAAWDGWRIHLGFRMAVAHVVTPRPPHLS